MIAVRIAAYCCYRVGGIFLYASNGTVVSNSDTKLKCCPLCIFLCIGQQTLLAVVNENTEILEFCP